MCDYPSTMGGSLGMIGRKQWDKAVKEGDIQVRKLDLLAKAIADASVNRPVGIRTGQHVFNVVYSYLPDEANKLRGGPADPFYKDERIPLFWSCLIDLIYEVG